MPLVEIGGSGEALRFDVERTTAQIWKAGVELEIGDLSARSTIYDPYERGFRDLADFFDDVARRWRGWRDARTWKALDGDLRLEARHDGHIRLQVSMGEASPFRWSVTGTVTLEPGEQLRQITEELRALGEAQ